MLHSPWLFAELFERKINCASTLRWSTHHFTSRTRCPRLIRRTTSWITVNSLPTLAMMLVKFTESIPNDLSVPKESFSTSCCSGEERARAKRKHIYEDRGDGLRQHSRRWKESKLGDILFGTKWKITICSDELFRAIYCCLGNIIDK